MSNYKDLYKDIFDNPKNYKNRNYNANGLFKKSPIFIGGSGRSGTTILARTLSQHPDTLNFVEVRFLLLLKNKLKLHDKLPYFYRDEKIYNKIIRGLKVAGYRDADKVYSKKVLNNISMNDSSTAIKRFFEIGLLAWNKSVVIEKTPHTFLIADKLYKIFPNIKYIHTFRDPRDIFASVKPLHWGPDNSKKFVSWYNNLMRRAYETRKRIPKNNYMLVRLEDLIKNLDTELEKIFRFSGLEFKDEFSNIINPKKAHIRRFLKDLSEKEIDKVWNGCRKEYMKWVKLYKHIKRLGDNNE